MSPSAFVKIFKITGSKDDRQLSENRNKLPEEGFIKKLQEKRKADTFSARTEKKDFKQNIHLVELPLSER
jgi:hypothetical protein